MGVQYLDSEKLYYSFVSGAQEVINNKKNLNEINVFPVADGDTGSNLSSTMHAIILDAKILHTVKATMGTIADAALIGARGNSGIIIAQYINGIFMSLLDEEKINMVSFAETVKNAVPYAYSAIANPVEGTIITVIKDWAESVYRNKEKAVDFQDLFSKAMTDALHSLERTTKQLQVLEDSHVVDSGAKGFVHFIEGFLAFIKSGKLGAELAEADEDFAFNEDLIHSNEMILHRYCTEALVAGESIDHEAIKQSLSQFGDSLIVAGNDRKARIHIHTNNPEKIFQVLRREGVIVQQKADDMVRQNEDAFERKYDIALVTDSIADVPQEVIDRYQIHMVPLSLHFDDTSYLDKVTMTSEIFYPMLDELDEYPTSSQPNPVVIENYLRTLTAHYKKVIIVTVAKEQSGTYSVFRKAAEKYAGEGKEVVVIDSKKNSGAEGLLVMKTAELIHSGKGMAEIIREIESLREKTNILVSVNTLKYMVRSGRLGKVSGFAAKTLNLKPVISIDANGKGKIEKKAFSDKANMRKIMAILNNVNKKDKITRYAVVHANDASRAEAFSLRCTKLLGKEPEYIMDISTIVGMSAGVGSVAVSYMCEEGI